MTGKAITSVSVEEKLCFVVVDWYLICISIKNDTISIKRFVEVIILLKSVYYFEITVMMLDFGQLVSFRVSQLGYHISCSFSNLIQKSESWYWTELSVWFCDSKENVHSKNNNDSYFLETCELVQCTYNEHRIYYVRSEPVIFHCARLSPSSFITWWSMASAGQNIRPTVHANIHDYVLEAWALLGILWLETSVLLRTEAGVGCACHIGQLSSMRDNMQWVNDVARRESEGYWY